MTVTYQINADPRVRCLSNFSKHPVTIDGDTYSTSEHFYQAAKFFGTDPEWAVQVAAAPSPRKSRDMGNDRSHPIHPKWASGESVKVMLRVLLEKARQHPEVLAALKATGNELIAERADWDSYWGDGPDGNGKNMLGKLWMIVRDVL